jgi:hypothetical protein
MEWEEYRERAMTGKSDVRGLWVKDLQEIFGRQDPGQTYNNQQPLIIHVTQHMLQLNEKGESQPQILGVSW